MRATIEVKGARENNLKNVQVEIPRDRLTVVTGVSGSGKSSLAFDMIYAEGQRRLLASMSTFAKRFVGQLKKPDVDFVHGLSPVVSIEQKNGGSQSSLDRRHDDGHLGLPEDVVRDAGHSSLSAVWGSRGRAIPSPDDGTVVVPSPGS